MSGLLTAAPPEGAPSTSPSTGRSQPPVRPHAPTMALRTYRVLRLGVLAVIALLAIGVVRESLEASPHCWQGSISAYYYTPVRSVFVGALVVLGFTMIVLWGKTAWEDALFNLAGMLAPVVAFVPTGDSNKCLLVDPSGAQVTTNAEKQAVLDASHAAVDNNMFAYLWVLGLALGVLLIVGPLAQTGRLQTSLIEQPLAFWGPWAAAAGLWAFGLERFHRADRTWLYQDAHARSATVMFGFIVLAIVAVGHEKWSGYRHGHAGARIWALGYWGLAALMTAGALVLHFWPRAWGTAWFFAHQILWIETWMITGVAIFWLLQTWDRWDHGAPLRTRAERARADLRH